MRPFKKSKSKTVRNLEKREDTRSVFSYYTNDRPTGSIKRVGERRNARFKWRHLPTYLSVLAIVISILYCLSVSPDPKIRSFTPGTNTQTFLRSTDDYQKAIGKLISSSIWNSNKLTIDTGALSAKILQEFPELSDASVTLPIINRKPIVELAAAKPVLALRNKSDTFVLDNKGRAIIKASDAKRVNMSQLPLITDESGLTASVGKTVLPTKNVTFILSVVAQLKAKNLTVQSMTLPAVPNDLHVRLVGQPYYIKFDLLGDPRIQAGDFLAVKEKLDADHVTPAEYVDVRVEEKVYYK